VKNRHQPKYLLDGRPYPLNVPATTLRCSQSDQPAIPSRMSTVTASRAFRVAGSGIIYHTPPKPLALIQLFLNLDLKPVFLTKLLQYSIGISVLLFDNEFGASTNVCIV